jgi:hypothetical protein
MWAMPIVSMQLLRQTEPPQNATDGGWRHADLGGNLLAGVALPA